MSGTLLQPLTPALRSANIDCRYSTAFPCNVLAGCLEQGSSPRACFQAVVTTPCSQLESFAAAQPPATIDRVCSGLGDAVQYLQSTASTTDLATFLTWWERDFAPCAQQICARTSHPIQAAALQQLPRQLLSRVVDQQLSATQRFFLRYGAILTLVLAGVILALLALVLIRPGCPASPVSEEILAV